MNEKIFSKFYYNLKNPASYSGSSKFYKFLKDKNLKIKLSDVKKWMTNQSDITLHKPIKKKFLRNRVYAFGVDHIWQADLVDLKALAKYNNGYRYLFCCIDVFRKYAWVIPLKNKSSLSILECFQKIFKERKPLKIQTDKGKEFLNSIVRKFLKSENVDLYQTNSEMKACIVERFNRTIKEKMWRYFSKNNTFNYLDILPDLIDSYNKTYHRSIKMRPIDVTIKNEKQVYKNLYGYNNYRYININFKVGDKVRIAKYKTLFDKGYTPNWTSEIFEINKVIPRTPVVYEIKDLNNEIIEGVFYEQELQKVYKLTDDS